MSNKEQRRANHDEKEREERERLEDETLDKSRAWHRGQRVQLLVESVMNVLDNEGVRFSIHPSNGATSDAKRRVVRIELFHLFCDDLYGNAGIDIPEKWRR